MIKACHSKHRIWNKAIAMAVVCLFLVNSVTWAYPMKAPQKSTLAVPSQLNREELKQRATALAAVLMHPAANEALHTQIMADKEIFGEDWELCRADELDFNDIGIRGNIKDRVEELGKFKLIRVTDLFKKTGQFAHIGLSGKYKIDDTYYDYGMPVVYIDVLYYDKANKATLRHEIDELIQWEELRSIIAKVYCIDRNQINMREWVKTHIGESDKKLDGTKYQGLSSLQIAECIHKSSWSLNGLYKLVDIGNDKKFYQHVDYEYIRDLYDRYHDEEGKDVNIAAAMETEIPEKYFAKIKEVFGEGIIEGVEELDPALQREWELARWKIIKQFFAHKPKLVNKTDVSFPADLNVIGTDFCNFNCRFCCANASPQNKNFINPKYLLQFLLAIKKITGEDPTVTLTGGEITAHKREFLALLEKVGRFVVNIQSNAWFAENFEEARAYFGEMAQRLGKDRFISFSPSLDYAHDSSDTALNRASNFIHASLSKFPYANINLMSLRTNEQRENNLLNQLFRQLGGFPPRYLGMESDGWSRAKNYLVRSFRTTTLEARFIPLVFHGRAFLLFGNPDYRPLPYNKEDLKAIDETPDLLWQPRVVLSITPQGVVVPLEDQPYPLQLTDITKGGSAEECVREIIMRMRNDPLIYSLHDQQAAIKMLEFAKEFDPDHVSRVMHTPIFLREQSDGYFVSVSRMSNQLLYWILLDPAIRFYVTLRFLQEKVKEGKGIKHETEIVPGVNADTSPEQVKKVAYRLKNRVSGIRKVAVASPSARKSSRTPDSHDNGVVVQTSLIKPKGSPAKFLETIRDALLAQALSENGFAFKDIVSLRKCHPSTVYKEIRILISLGILERAKVGGKTRFRFSASVRALDAKHVGLVIDTINNIEYKVGKKNNPLQRYEIPDEEDMLFVKELARNVTDIEKTQYLLDIIPSATTDEGKYYVVRYNDAKLRDYAIKVGMDADAFKRLLDMYVRILRVRLGGEERVELKPSGGIKQPLVSMECYNNRAKTGRPDGIGHVNIDGQDIDKDSTLRIIDMANIAFAVSNIPLRPGDGELDQCDHLIAFIQAQFKELTGRDMSREEILRPDRLIMLPAIKPIPFEKLKEYYEFTIKQLEQAA